jgi:hypothetical protein
MPVKTPRFFRRAGLSPRQKREIAAIAPNFASWNEKLL